jgi:hypothetical protein
MGEVALYPGINVSIRLKKHESSDRLNLFNPGRIVNPVQTERSGIGYQCAENGGAIPSLHFSDSSPYGNNLR